MKPELHYTVADCIFVLVPDLRGLAVIWIQDCRRPKDAVLNSGPESVRKKGVFVDIPHLELHSVLIIIIVHFQLAF